MLKNDVKYISKKNLENHMRKVHIVEMKMKFFFLSSPRSLCVFPPLLQERNIFSVYSIYSKKSAYGMKHSWRKWKYVVIICKKRKIFAFFWFWIFKDFSGIFKRDRIKLLNILDFFFGNSWENFRESFRSFRRNLTIEWFKILLEKFANLLKIC